MDNPAATAQQALESLIDAARRLGATQAKKGFGCYTKEDALLERAWHESITKHSADLCGALCASLCAELEQSGQTLGAQQQRDAVDDAMAKTE
jgi:hypothetical protein